MQNRLKSGKLSSGKALSGSINRGSVPSASPQTPRRKILKQYIMNGCIAYTLIIVFLAADDCLGHTTDFSAYFLLHMLAATSLVTFTIFVTDRLPLRTPLLFLAVQVTSVFTVCYFYMGLVGQAFTPSPGHALRMYLLTVFIYLLCTFIINLDNNKAAEAINRKLREQSQGKSADQTPPSAPPD